MTKMVSHLRRLRYEYATKRGKHVPMHEVSRETGIGRGRLSALELGTFELVENNEMIALSTFYTKVLGRQIRIADLLEIEINNKKAFGQPVLTGF